MPLRPSVRHALNWANGMTFGGLTLARWTRCQISPGPLRTYIAAGYPLPIPGATCFVIGDVIFCRRSQEWLRAAVNRRLLIHELRHTYQYAYLGPAFWPLYFASSGWSYLTTGTYGLRNHFERRAGLADGGYVSSS